MEIRIRFGPQRPSPLFFFEHRELALEASTTKSFAWNWVCLGALGVTGATAGLFLPVAYELGPDAGRAWFVAMTVTCLVEAAIVGRKVWTGRRDPAAPALTPADWITVARGFLVALVAGFIPLAHDLAGREGILPWVPGVLFLVACVLDGVDGKVARRKGVSSVRGAFLDMRFDALTLLVGTLLAVRLGRAPFWFTLVGLAFYLFAGGRMLRKAMGETLGELPPSAWRRTLAGGAMGFTAGLLLPLLKPPATTVAAVVIAVPFLGQFVRDWLSLKVSTVPEHRCDEP